MPGQGTRKGGKRKIGRDKKKCEKYKEDDMLRKSKARRMKNRLRKRLNWLKNILKRNVITEDIYKKKVAKANKTYKLKAFV